MSEIVRRADAFAEAAHRRVGQLRKYTNTPYIEHPRAVSRLLRDFGHDDPVLHAGALLHDVIEDCGVSADDLEREFGREIAALVVEVTDVYVAGSGGTREARKILETDRLSRTSRRAQTLKVADLIDNSRSILAHDPDFAGVYLAEKQRLVEALRLADPRLRREARRITEQGLVAIEAKAAKPRPR